MKLKTNRTWRVLFNILVIVSLIILLSIELRNIFAFNQLGEENFFRLLVEFALLFVASLSLGWLLNQIWGPGIEKQSYRALFENTGVAMAILDENLEILLINQQAKDFLGYDWAQVGAKARLKELLVNKSDVEKVLKYDKLRQQGEAPNKYELELEDSEGQTKIALIKINLLPNNKQKIISAIDITERKKAEEKIRYMNYHDSLTGLYNRKYHQKKLAELDCEESYPLSVIMADNNGLKLINDTFGHNKGDDLIEETANILTSVVRVQDILARWGGDEFVILAPNTSHREAKDLIAKINQACTESDFQPITPHISLGAATKREDEKEIEEVINLAETRMYDSKMESKKELEDTMVNALEESLLEMDYETQGHTERVEDLALDLGEKLDLSQEQLDNLELLARLHDIGKLAVLNNLLDKGAELSAEKADKLDDHPKIGYRVVKNFRRLTPIANSVLHHHENWDGSGYPDGLTGEEIPYLARIIRVVDAYDIMTNKERNTTENLSHQEAIKEIKGKSGVEFDPQVVAEFINLIGNKSAV